MELRDLFARTVRVGGSAAYVGAFDIVVVSKPFTPGEDAVMAWVQAQDDAMLVDMFPSGDGFDVTHLRRLHTKQTMADAIQEQSRHLSACLIAT